MFSHREEDLYPPSAFVAATSTQQGITASLPVERLTADDGAGLYHKLSDKSGVTPFNYQVGLAKTSTTVAWPTATPSSAAGETIARAKV
jgi:hypothetical protein